MKLKYDMIFLEEKNSFRLKNVKVVVLCVISVNKIYKL